MDLIISEKNTGYNSEPHPRICLQKRICGFGIIIPYPAGVLYMNQVDGTSLCPVGLEGLYVPIYNKTYPNPLNDLWGFFNSQGRKNNSETADFLDALLVPYARFNPIIKVDRNKIDEIREAWVPVTIEEDHKHSIFEDFSPRSGILTWENSD